MKIKAFTPLRPNNETVQKLVCPPYDVVNKSEAKDIANKSKESFMHIIRAEVDLNDSISPYSEEVYEKSLENLNRLINENKLIREAKPSLYIYKIEETNNQKHKQIGLVTLSSVEDYNNNVIKKHEKTRKDKEEDRIKLTYTLRANTGPVFLTYRNNNTVDGIISKQMDQQPLYSVDYENTKHTLWQVEDTEILVKEIKKVPCAYVADGHHRSASAAKVCEILSKEKNSNSNNADHNWFLSVLFPDNQLQILPYNRAITGLNNLTGDEFINKLSKVSKLTTHSKNEKTLPYKQGSVNIYVDGTWHTLDFSENNTANSLDVDLLQQNVINPILGIKDPRTDSRMTFIGGNKDNDALKNLVDNNKADIAFSLFPVSINQLMEISDKGEMMPPKSTWFEPKLLSGFLIHTF